MNPRMRKRLDAVCSGLGVGGQIITVIQYANETGADVDQKLARWRAGEPVEGVSARSSDGDDMVLTIRRFAIESMQTNRQP